MTETIYIYSRYMPLWHAHGNFTFTFINGVQLFLRQTFKPRNEITLVVLLTRNMNSNIT